MLEAYIDGGCEPNPGGTCSWGFLVQKIGSLPDVTQWEGYGVVGSGPKMSNNVGEYSALLEFLRWFDKQPTEDVIVYSDSQLLINQINGLWKVNSDKLFYPVYSQVQILRIQNLAIWKDKIKFRWIPREQNLADSLTVKALKEVGIFRRN